MGLIRELSGRRSVRVLPHFIHCIACSVMIFVVLQEQGKQSDNVRNIPIFLNVEEANSYCYIFRC